MNRIAMKQIEFLNKLETAIREHDCKPVIVSSNRYKKALRIKVPEVSYHFCPITYMAYVEGLGKFPLSEVSGAIDKLGITGEASLVVTADNQILYADFDGKLRKKLVAMWQIKEIGNEVQK